MRTCLVVALILGVLAAPAAADTEPLPVGTVVLPGDGQVWTALSGPFETPQLVVYAIDYTELPDAFAFAVATSPATDTGGLLAGPADRYIAPARPDRPGIYAAPIGLGGPGTYYWQASYAEGDDVYASPVRTLTVIAQPSPDTPAPPVAPAPPTPAPPLVATPRPPAGATVRIAVRRAIHAATHMLARKLVYRCATAPAAATCHPSWRDVRFRYRGTLELTFGASPITAAFRGTREPRGHGHARGVIWATSL
jgi:hypothetical protein